MYVVVGDVVVGVDFLVNTPEACTLPCWSPLEHTGPDMAVKRFEQCNYYTESRSAILIECKYVHFTVSTPERCFSTQSSIPPVFLQSNDDRRFPPKRRFPTHAQILPFSFRPKTNAQQRAFSRKNPPLSEETQNISVGNDKVVIVGKQKPKPQKNGPQSPDHVLD